MERNYLTLTAIFASIALVSLLGFYTSYISFFPAYQKFPWIIHLHFIAFLSWLTLTIVQPMLVKNRKTRLHRKLGKLAYVIAPVMILSMCLVVLAQTRRLLGESIESAAISSVIGCLDIVSFTIYFTIAMVNRRNVRWHAAFMVSCAIITLNPGMSRLFNNIQPGLGLLVAVIVPFLIPLAIIIYEKISLKKPILKSPYALFFLCWATEIAILMTLPGTEFWRNMIQRLA
jgi:hypothetical protein